ncbi:LysR family transcriptional regulator [Burkholderia cepacia]|uniref:LysR family transcriptional regulator n=1 Tax=Burkholderia cepacia TaxID=292 RepID=A0AAX2RAW8_BURCE|nr:MULTISPECIES: LysR substrate-binding domain-containing protein [Burkholderia]MBJ9756087.1 LysR family transcriptional regulator [Burkholderia cepacia]MCA8327605.1 LysR family transcriptional regulator [Burkholderia cepacia]MCR5892969.1 LysR family transcriptional regulator [Burkholderia sp. HAN2018]RQT61967.1 LysR family transcriptional regulator [Burkholderia cepacia]RQZ64190.1 LysR family transcriptional regulator [Burkholderia cepacia]
MRNRLPPLNPLRAFEAAARRGSVSAAADELHVTASAVSHQIRILESTLGVALFVRSKARVKLTPEGEALLEPVGRAFDLIANAAVRLDSPAAVGNLVVSTPLSLTSRWLARRIGDFLERYPGIHLKVIPSNDDREVYSQHVDVCIRYGEGNWRNRRVELLSHPALFPVVSPALMNGPDAIRKMQDLSGRPLFCEHSGSWMRWLAEAKADKLPNIRILEIGNAHIGVEAAARGQGVALGDSLSVRDDLIDGTLVRPFSAAVPARYAYYVVARHELADTPLVTAFTSWLHAHLA